MAKPRQDGSAQGWDAKVVIVDEMAQIDAFEMVTPGPADASMDASGGESETRWVRFGMLSERGSVLAKGGWRRCSRGRSIRVRWWYDGELSSEEIVPYVTLEPAAATEHELAIQRFTAGLLAGWSACGDGSSDMLITVPA